MHSMSVSLNRGRKLSDLSWRARLSALPDFLGYPRRAFVVIVGLILLATLMEGVGIALIYPIVELMQSGETAEALAGKSFIFSLTFKAFAIFGLPVTLDFMLLAAAVLILARQVLSYISAVLRAFYAQRSAQRISSRTFAMFALSNIAHTERLRSGTLVNALFTESKRAAMFAQSSQNLVGSLLRILVYVALLMLVSWEATIVGFSLLAFVAVVVSRSSVRGSRLTGRLINEANDRLARYANERFSLFRLMKVQGTERLEANLFAEGTRNLRDLNVDIARYAARIRVMIEGTTVIGVLALIYLAVSIFDMRLAVLGVFLVAIFRLLPVIQEIAVTRQQLAANLNSVYYIDRISLDAQAAAEPDAGDRPFPGLADAIRFEGVSFAYPPGDDAGEPVPALHGIDLAIPAGRTTALLGPSGAGKSTLIDLIPRLRAPTAGRILFDDVPADDIRLADLRAAIAMVSQDTLIIDGTVAENLRYGQPDATQEQIVAAAKAAFADGFIRDLAKGYDTVVGERGVLLSGGQKQRLALARALLAKVPILLLDEPTSALDAESEQAVQRALETLQAGDDVTIIIIAHRLSTVRHADQIVVLEGGRLLGTGTHDALMESAAWYRKIVELQTGERVPAADAAAVAVAGTRAP